MDKSPPHDATEENIERFSREKVEIEGNFDPQNPNALKCKVQTDEDTTIIWNLISIRQNAQEFGKEILHTQKTENVWRVEVVTHSMRGLISRYYIHHSITKFGWRNRPSSIS